MILNDNEKNVLDYLADGYDCGEFGYGYGYSSFAPICEATGLDRKVVRLACRSLKRKGLAHYQRGLWTDNGEPAGAGYAATQAGVDLLSAITAEGGKE